MWPFKQYDRRISDKGTGNALHESQAMLRLVLDTLPVGVFWKDLNSVYIGCNQVFARDAGLQDPGQIQGKTDFELAWKSLASQYQTDDRNVIQTGCPKLFYEERIETSDGCKTWLRTSKVPLIDSQGEIKGILGVYEDISALKLINQELDEKKQKLEAMIDSIPDHMTLLDRNRTIIWANHVAQDHFGSDMVGKTCDAAYPHGGRCEHCIVNQVFQSGTLQEKEEEIIVQDGSKRVFWCIANVAGRNEDGQPALVLEIYRDITDRKAAERELATAAKKLTFMNQDLREFTRIAAHDLKTPVRAIGMLSDWITDDYARQHHTEGQRHAELLHTRAVRIHSFLDAIQRYTEITLDDITFTNVDMNVVIHEVEDTIHTTKPFTLTTENTLPVIIAHKPHMKKVFANLIRNAVHFNDKNVATVTIGHEETTDTWKFWIKDNGTGIEEEHHERIFQLFQILHQRDETEGVGIGLPIVRKIVELYEGTIWVDSVKAQGCTFYFTISKQFTNLSVAPQHLDLEHAAGMWYI